MGNVIKVFSVESYPIFIRRINEINAISFRRILECEKIEENSGVTVKLSKFYYFCCRVNQSECSHRSIVFQSCSKSIWFFYTMETRITSKRMNSKGKKKRFSPKTLNIVQRALSKRIQFNTICCCVKCVADDNRCWITVFCLFSILSKRNSNENLKIRKKKNKNIFGIIFTNCGPFDHSALIVCTISVFHFFHILFSVIVFYFPESDIFIYPLARDRISMCFLLSLILFINFHFYKSFVDQILSNS